MLTTHPEQVHKSVYSWLFKATRRTVDRRTLRSIENMARRMEPALRNAFLAAVRSAKTQATLQVIEQALRSIDPAAAIREATRALDFERMRETLAQIVEASGFRATESLRARIGPIGGRAIARFDMVNPYAAQYARTEVGNLIQGITQTTQEGIQGIINRGIEEGIDVRTSARNVQAMIGLTEQQTDWAMNFEFRLLDRGATDIEGKVQRYANKLLRQRALTISRTESLSALNAGQQSAWRAAQDQGFLDGTEEQRWIVARDERLCEICAPMDNQRRKVGEFFETGDGRQVVRPPQTHPRCRCTLGLAL